MTINIPFRFIFFLCFLVILFHSTSSNMMLPVTPLDKNACDMCTKVNDKFIEGYKKTAGSNFGGGNTAWEEKKLKGYAKSETRFIEIMENVCEPTDPLCNSFVEKHEDSIADWYQTSTPESLHTFYKWLCIDKAKVCCPKGTFGKNCRRCQYGDNGLICSGNGDCDGDGTTAGNGQCNCYEEYKGEKCLSCNDGYIQSKDENNEVICDDIDECRANIFVSPCRLYKCRNTEGSYECYGEPFYYDSSKMTTLSALLLTASFLLFKEMHGLASITLMMTSVFIVLFARNIL